MKRRVGLLLILLVVLAVAVELCALKRRTPALGAVTVTFLDVGQGDASILELPGGDAVLIDLEMPVMNALLTLSEGAPLDPGRRRRALDARERFLDQARIGYVVIDSARASSALRSFAVEFLDLVRVDSSGGLELYRPRRAPPPLSPARRCRGR